MMTKRFASAGREDNPLVCLFYTLIKYLPCHNPVQRYLPCQAHGAWNVALTPWQYNADAGAQLTYPAPEQTP